MGLSNLLDMSGDGAKCWYAQIVQSVLPDAASTTLALLSAVTNLVNTAVKPITKGLDCPVVDTFDQSLCVVFVLLRARLMIEVLTV